MKGWSFRILWRRLVVSQRNSVSSLSKCWDCGQPSHSRVELWDAYTDFDSCIATEHEQIWFVRFCNDLVCGALSYNRKKKRTWPPTQNFSCKPITWKASPKIKYYPHCNAHCQRFSKILMTMEYCEKLCNSSVGKVVTGRKERKKERASRVADWLGCAHQLFWEGISSVIICVVI